MPNPIAVIKTIIAAYFLSLAIAFCIGIHIGQKWQAKHDKIQRLERIFRK